MIEWDRIRHFKRSEYAHPDRMDLMAVYMMDGMRHEEDLRRRRAGKNGIIITLGETYALRPKNPDSQHPKGKAQDAVIRDAVTREPLDTFDQFLIASRYFWTGIGMYPFWNSPGIHVDTRPLTLYQRRSTWWRDEDGQYLAVEKYIERRWGDEIFFR